jgi:hypothetical protein
MDPPGWNLAGAALGLCFSNRASTLNTMHPHGIQLMNEKGDRRGFVEFKVADGRPRLEDLWIMQGSLCDLRCKHCYTASSPLNNRLQQITFEELKPHLDEAARFGVRKIYFTGGEVFVNEAVLRGRASRNEDFLRNLSYALEIAPVEILTNGRRHIRDHFAPLAELYAKHGARLRIRITLESPEPARHDAIRGRGTFAQTVESVRELAAAGFIPIITAERPLLGTQSDDEIRQSYQAIFPDIAIEVNLIENLIESGHQIQRLASLGATPASEVFVTTHCFGILQKPAESLMCHFSRCIQKIDGSLRYYPCPVIYDDERFDLGPTLQASFQRVYIGHKSCYDYCLKGRGGSCRTRPV